MTSPSVVPRSSTEGDGQRGLVHGYLLDQLPRSPQTFALGSL